MNLRQPYEQLIADKLRQLRAPDANSSWQHMKQLLDDDEDTKGGSRRRPPGNNGLWRIGMLAVVLIASFWLYVEKSPLSKNSLSKNNKAETQQADNKTTAVNKNTSNNNQTATIDNTTTLTNSVADKNTSAKNTSAGNTSKTNADYNAAAVAPAIKNNSTDKNKAVVASNSNTSTAVPLAMPGAAVNNSVALLKHGAEKISAGNTTVNHINTVNNVGTPGNLTATTLSPSQKNKLNKQLGAVGTENEVALNPPSSGADAIVNNDNNNIAGVSANQKYNHKLKTSAGKVKNNTTNAGGDITFTNTDNNRNIAGNNVPGNNFGSVNQNNSSKEKTWFEKLSGLRMEDPISSFNTSLAAGDSIAETRDVSNLLTNETKKVIAKAKRDKEIAVLDKQDKKFHLNLSNLFKPFSMHMDAEPWWGAGIALNAPITVNAQNRFNYNMNAKSSTLTDYIPSPYLQFHLNNYVYFQTELNFITPQYTPQLLLYRQSNDISAQMAGTSTEKSIYVQKMYYFNWPVSLHYSPINNLFLSGGIQFSSFQSGLATIEEKQYPTALGIDHASSISSTTLKFKDDSIAAKIKPNEWRWQVGAEYYINRFSVGLRYNQSFKNAVNTTVLPGLPPTVSRNQSLLFFVRYNLFESRQKNSVPKNQ